MKSGAALALALAATAAAALALDLDDEPSAVHAVAEAPGAPHVDPHAGVPGAPPLGAATDPGGVLPPGHPPIEAPEGGGLPPGHPMVNGANGPVAVPPLEGGVTVEQIVRDAAKLEGKRVRLAAKVVKATPNILGRTWLHVQDGTGEASRGDHDLVVTTRGEVALGAILEIEGTVVVDKDLGRGYRYEVLLEDATIRPSPDLGTEEER